MSIVPEDEYETEFSKPDPQRALLRSDAANKCENREWTQDYAPHNHSCMA